MPKTASSALAEQFEHPKQQEEASSLGIWTFLSTEILFFGGLFLSYSVYRVNYPKGFAEGSRHLYFWIGTTNTFVLLTSSLFMALAVHSIQDGNQKRLRRFLTLTFIFGATFLGLKLVEYYLDGSDSLVPGFNFNPSKFADPQHVELFLFLYFAMTGLHAVHMTLGLGALTYLYVKARQKVFPRATILRSRSSDCTGTSSTWCGCSFTLCCISLESPDPETKSVPVWASKSNDRRSERSFWCTSV